MAEYGYGYGGRPFDYSRPAPQPNPPMIMRGPPAPLYHASPAQYYAAPPQISHRMDPYQLPPSARGVPMNYSSPSGDGPIYRIPSDRFQSSQQPDFSNLKPGDVYRVKEVKPVTVPTYYAQPSSQSVRVVHDPHYGYY